MKTVKLIVVGLILFASSQIHAQLSVNVNIGKVPAWAPVGYAESDYYYLPDVGAYYDVRATQFIYYGSGRWIRSRYLPNKYRDYDLYRGHKVVLHNYHGSRPYSHFNSHKVKYYKGYDRGHANPGHHKNRRVYVSNRPHEDYKKHNKYKYYINKKHDDGNDDDHNRRRSYDQD